MVYLLVREVNFSILQMTCKIHLSGPFKGSPPLLLAALRSLTKVNCRATVRENSRLVLQTSEGRDSLSVQFYLLSPDGLPSVPTPSSGFVPVPFQTQPPTQLLLCSLLDRPVPSRILGSWIYDQQAFLSLQI